MRKLCRLTMRERRLLFEAWCLLLGLDLALRCLPFTRVMRFCQNHRTTGNEEDPRSRPSSTQLARLVTIASRYSPTTATCLTEALALSRLLSRQGIATNLRIGVAHRYGDLAAHAWLEQDGRVILGNADAGAYSPLRPLSREAVHQ